MPEAFDQHWDRGWKFYEEEKFEDAIVEWREASRLAPENGHLHDSIGSALSAMGQREAAITEWQEAIRLTPDYDRPYSNLANALLGTGDVEGAFAIVQTALPLCSGSVDLYNQLGFHLMKQAKANADTAKLAEAGAAFEKVTLLDPSNAYASEHLAQVQWHLKQRHEAIKTLKAATAANPDNAAR